MNYYSTSVYSSLSIQRHFFDKKLLDIYSTGISFELTESLKKMKSMINSMNIML
jgi:hypothetical protein